MPVASMTTSVQPSADSDSDQSGQAERPAGRVRSAGVRASMAPHDATWLAELLAHGLIQGSFVPDEPTQEMRNCLRMRKQFVRERSSHVQRIQKTLEDANIRLDSVITDIIVLSGS